MKLRKEKEKEFQKLENRPGVPRGIMNAQKTVIESKYNRNIEDLEYKRKLFLDRMQFLIPFISLGRK